MLLSASSRSHFVTAVGIGGALIATAIGFNLNRNEEVKHSNPTLLNEIGRSDTPIAPATMRAWAQSLRDGNNTPAERALLHLRLGEAQLATCEPEKALASFAAAKKANPTDKRLVNLATYDSAMALFYRGRYAEARDGMMGLLKRGGGGFDRRNAALWIRHAAACAGYHEDHLKLGIIQPPSLDPFCGAAVLAVCLKHMEEPYTRDLIVNRTPHTGEGSSLKDIATACERSGVASYAVMADKKGLIALPKPVVAHVERDHFIAVTKADKSGVSYTCSDCGPWPGGDQKITWDQWKAMDADVYLAVVKKGGVEDLALKQALDDKKGPILLASTKPQSSSLKLSQINALTSALEGHVTTFLPLLAIVCGQKPDSLHCPPYEYCWWDCLHKQLGPWMRPIFGPRPTYFGGSDGDPVNVATGEEEYQPQPDLEVYNPIGPGITWRRYYNSLSNYQSGFGYSWSHTLNVGVEVNLLSRFPGGEPGGGEIGGGDVGRGGAPPQQLPIGKVVFENGSKAPFYATGTPSAGTPTINCTVGTGTPMKVVWKYNPSTLLNYFEITFADRSKWVTRETGVNNFLHLDKFYDRSGNYLWFTYSNYATGFETVERLTSIKDSAGVALLTITNNSQGNITEVADRYNRSVYYHTSRLSTTSTFAPWRTFYDELDSVSQIVTTGTGSPPNRFTLGYQNSTNGEGSETVPFLHTISTPSPSGTGTSTATINYDAVYSQVANIVDANGNKRIYSVPGFDFSKTKVTVKNASNTTVYEYTIKYNANMSPTEVYNASNQLVYSLSYASGNTPYQASSITDGTSHTTTCTWDTFGNPVTVTAPRGTVTTYTYNYVNFPLGELTQIQQGTKTPVTYTYYEPSGLCQTESSAIPGLSGSASTQTTSYTFDARGNIMTVTRPGNAAMAYRTTTYTYTGTGGFRHPNTVTDSAGKTRTFVYDARGNMLTTTDAEGNVSDYTYNIADQVLTHSYPATGMTGVGRGSETLTYLFPGSIQTATTFKDESGATVGTDSFTYGPEGELLSRGGRTEAGTFTYDAQYRVKTSTDGNGHTTTLNYDTNGNLSSVVDPLSGTTQFTSYDVMGNCLTRVNARGQTANYTFGDPDGQLSAISYPANTSHNVTVTYDAYDRPIAQTDGTGSSAMTYDDCSLTTSSTRTYTGLSAQTFTYAYNPDGSRASMVTSAGTFSYLYDAAGRCTSMTSPVGIATWTYFDNGWLDRRTLPNGVYSDHTYAGTGNLIGLETRNSGGTLIASYGGQLGGYRTLTQSVSSVPGTPVLSGTTDYQFDAKERLTSEQSTISSGYTKSYTYDTAGNATSYAGTSIAYTNANGINGTGFVYDADGNPTTWKGTTATWDYENRMTSYGTDFSADYRGDGLRAYKAIGVNRTYYLYDNGKPIIELDGSGNLTALNVFGPDGLIARQTSATTTSYAFDLSGNVVQRLNNSQTVLTATAYLGYGSISAGSAVRNDPFGYGGRWGYYYDTDTGLYLTGKRYYDEAAGRYLNRDPIGSQGGTNMYLYCASRPVSYIDPTGEVGAVAVATIVAGGICAWWDIQYMLGNVSATEACEKCMEAVYGGAIGAGIALMPLPMIPGIVPVITQPGVVQGVTGGIGGGIAGGYAGKWPKPCYPSFPGTDYLPPDDPCYVAPITPVEQIPIRNMPGTPVEGRPGMWN